MKFFSLAFLVFFVALNASAQSPFSAPKFGETGKMKLNTAFPWRVLGTADKFVAVSVRMSKVMVTEYDYASLEMQKQFKLDLKYEKKTLNMIESTVFNDEIYFLTSFYNSSKDQTFYFVQKYQGEGKLTAPRVVGSLMGKNKPRVTLSSQKYSQSLAQALSIRLVKSQNEEHLAVVYPKTSLQESNQDDTWSAIFFDRTMNRVEVEFTPPTSEMTFSEMTLSNKGELFLFGIEKANRINGSYYLGTQRGPVLNSQFLGEQYYALKISKAEGFQGSQKLSIDKGSIVSYKSGYVNDELVFCGFYKDSELQTKYTSISSGYFYFRLNEDLSILADNQVPFDENMADIQGFDVDEEDPEKELTEKQKKKKEKKDRKKLDDLIIQDIVLKPNGEVVFLAEQYDWWTSTNRVYNSATKSYDETTVTHFEFGDIFAVCLNPNGDHKWMRRIPKRQHSTEDFGFYSSYHLYASGEDIHLLLDTDRYWVEFETLKNAKWIDKRSARKEHVYGGLRIDNAGNVEKYVVAEGEEMEKITIAPSNSVVKDGRLIMFSRNNISLFKIEFGLTSFSLD